MAEKNFNNSGGIASIYTGPYDYNSAAKGLSSFAKSLGTGSSNNLSSFFDYYSPYRNNFNYNGFSSSSTPDWLNGATQFRLAGTGNARPMSELTNLDRNIFQNQEIEYLDEFGNVIGTGTRDSLFGQYGKPVMQGLEAATGIWQAYNAWNQNQMLREQLDFQKELANRNLANQAKMVNNAYDSSNNIMLGMSDKLTPQQREQFKEAVKQRYIDGSVIG